MIDHDIAGTLQGRLPRRAATSVKDWSWLTVPCATCGVVSSAWPPWPEFFVCLCIGLPSLCFVAVLIRPQRRSNSALRARSMGVGWRLVAEHCVCAYESRLSSSSHPSDESRIAVFSASLSAPPSQDVSDILHFILDQLFLAHRRLPRGGLQSCAHFAKHRATGAHWRHGVAPHSRRSGRHRPTAPTSPARRRYFRPTTGLGHGPAPPARGSSRPSISASAPSHRAATPYRSGHSSLAPSSRLPLLTREQPRRRPLPRAAPRGRTTGRGDVATLHRGLQAAPGQPHSGSRLRLPVGTGPAGPAPAAS